MTPGPWRDLGPGDNCFQSCSILDRSPRRVNLPLNPRGRGAPKSQINKMFSDFNSHTETEATIGVSMTGKKKIDMLKKSVQIIDTPFSAEKDKQALS